MSDRLIEDVALGLEKPQGRADEWEYDRRIENSDDKTKAEKIRE
jgi:hypothetical protein